MYLPTPEELSNTENTLAIVSLMLQTGSLVYVGSGWYRLANETDRDRGSIMAEKKQLWLAKNDNPGARTELHHDKPTLNPSGEMNSSTFAAYIRCDSDLVKPGHAIMVELSTIGEAVDCRPKPVPEMSIERNSRGWLILHAARSSMILDPDLLPEVKPNHRCRIAWDESGIRLIGTPERV